MKKIYVNTEGCIGCGACVGLDPEHFDFNEEGYSIVISQEDVEKEQLQNAINACPVNVISLEDIPEKQHDEEESVISIDEIKDEIDTQEETNKKTFEKNVTSFDKETIEKEMPKKKDSE